MLQSDVLSVAVAMRDCFELYASDTLRPSPLHSVEGSVFFEEPDVPQESSSVGERATAGTDAGAEPGEGVSDDDNLSDGGTAEAVSMGVAGFDDEGESEFVSSWKAHGWLKDNPLGTPTEREFHVLQQKLPVYRVLLTNKREAHL
jgi:hypothetical protein